ncbi:MAG: hypothetical protein A2X64_06065 [Ignavibacteria bacterium GWF2_33_9]|nr:MAG: hypothetical protein A2X64_06065 [Ignavibacteria bacterium GWF2_33_9]
MALKVNTIAPDFTIFDDSNNQVSLSDFKGKWVVLYFYPKDNTPGCTKEACDFQEDLRLFNNLNAEILGISPDSVKSHVNFKTKYKLDFKLLSDTEKEICKLYDILAEKSMFGKKYTGVVRTTYIINPEGEIVWVKSKVKVFGHINEVKETLKMLQV